MLKQPLEFVRPDQSELERHRKCRGFELWDVPSNKGIQGSLERVL